MPGDYPRKYRIEWFVLGETEANLKSSITDVRNRR